MKSSWRLYLLDFLLRFNKKFACFTLYYGLSNVAHVPLYFLYFKIIHCIKFLRHLPMALFNFFLDTMYASTSPVKPKSPPFLLRRDNSSSCADSFICEKNPLWNRRNPTVQEIHSMHFLHSGLAFLGKESVGLVGFEICSKSSTHSNEFFNPLNFWPIDKDFDTF